MAMRQVVYLSITRRIPSTFSSSSFSTSCIISSKWRLEQGLEKSPRKFGPLTNLPDYSFVDGRPAILSFRKLEKINYEKNLAKKIVHLTQEVDVGLQQYHERVEEEKKRKESILQSKLKPKGAALLNENIKSN